MGISWIPVFFKPFEFMKVNKIWDSSWVDAGGHPTYESWLSAVTLAKYVTSGVLDDFNNPFADPAIDPTQVFYYGGADSTDPTIYNIQIGNSRFIGN